MKKLLLVIIFFVVCNSISQNVFEVEKEENKLQEIKEEIIFSEPKIMEIGKYCMVSMDTNSFVIEPNNAILPMYTKTFIFPSNTKINSIDFRYSNLKNLYINKEILKAPLPVEMGKAFEYKFHEKYPFPKNWFSYSIGRGIYNGKDALFLSIHVYPIRQLKYNILQFMGKIEFEIKYEEAKEIERRKALLIISPPEFLNDLTPLAIYKEKYGIETRLISLKKIYNESIGRDEAEKIKYFIKDAIEKWNISYVMLVGNKEKMPVRYSHLVFDNDSFSFISDLYYADIYDANGNFSSWDTNGNGIYGEFNQTGLIDKMDLYPDVYVGRLLCNSSHEVKTMVEKIIKYETSEKPWFKNLIICAGDTHPTWKDILFKFAYKKGGIAWEGEYMGDIVAEYMKNFNAIKIYGSGILKGAKFLSIRNINENINRGAGFVYFSGHGTPYSWATHPPFGKIWLPLPYGYLIDNVRLLENKEKLAVIVLDACSCGDFDEIDSPMAWEFLKLENGGAIASYACSAVAFLLPGTLCTETLNGFMAISLFKSYMEGKNRAGEMLANSIIKYLNDKNALYGYILPYSLICIQEWTLFGDPSLKIG